MNPGTTKQTKSTKESGSLLADDAFVFKCDVPARTGRPKTTESSLSFFRVIRAFRGYLSCSRAALYIDDRAVGDAKVAQTEFAVFSADETAGVGIDTETPVSDEYDRASSQFTGKINKVTINLK